MMLSVLMDSPNISPQMGWEAAPRGMKNVQDMMTQKLRCLNPAVPKSCEPSSLKSILNSNAVLYLTLCLILSYNKANDHQTFNKMF